MDICVRCALEASLQPLGDLLSVSWSEEECEAWFWAGSPEGVRHIFVAAASLDGLRGAAQPSNSTFYHELNRQRNLRWLDAFMG